MRRPRYFPAVLVLFSLLSCSPGVCDTSSRFKTIRLPPGFEISLYAGGIPGARSMAIGPKGILFVGTRKEGKVYAVLDPEGKNRADEIITVASGLTMPNGVAYRDGSLYVAEVSKILRYDDISSRLRDPGSPVVLYDRFPDATHHGWKFIRFGPDGMLYVPVGAPCNICEVEDPFGSITRMKSDGTGFEIVARGVRNSVGFDWDPATKELWFTDNGRDWLGDDLPPDELNHAPVKGLHFGFPYRHGKDIPDPEFGDAKQPKELVPPARELGPHVAPLGMRFYTGSMFPKEYRNQIFIAEHGSWNRSTPIGYRITLVRLKDGKPTGYEVFAEGWLAGGRAWGRPVDLLVMPDGALLVSDDRAGAIYRITFKNQGSGKGRMIGPVPSVAPSPAVAAIVPGMRQYRGSREREKIVGERKNRNRIGGQISTIRRDTGKGGGS